MITSEISLVYAEALFRVAEEKNIVDQILTEYEQFIQIYKKENVIKLFLNSPSIAKDDKIKILKNELEKYFCKDFLNYIFLVITKNRQYFIERMFQEFIEIIHEKRDETKVNITSAIELDQEIIDRITNIIKTKINKSIITETKIDESVLGGLVLKIGDKQIDMSLKKELSSIERNMLEVKLDGVKTYE